MNFHFPQLKLCILNISLNYVTYLFSTEILWCKCYQVVLILLASFSWKSYTFFLCSTVTFVLSLKRNVTSVFFIFTSLKIFNLHQLSGKILSENVTYVLLPLMILYVPIKKSKFSKCDLTTEKCPPHNPPHPPPQIIENSFFFFENLSLMSFFKKGRCWPNILDKALD